MVRRSVVVRLAAAVANAMVALSACAGPAPHRGTPGPIRECALAPAVATVPESATVVVTSPVALAHAPRAATWGERFVFDLAYDSPTRLDCRGASLGGVAFGVREVDRSTFILEPAAGASLPRLTVRSATEADARDMIDAGIDLLLTDSPALAAYAATRSDVSSVPLGWNRTWVAVTARPADVALDTSVAFRASLARDVVRADARPATEPLTWIDRAGCPAAFGGAGVVFTASRRVLYPRDEPVARALAERIVALIGRGATAIGLAPNALASSLHYGSDLAYVLPVQFSPRDGCRRIDELVAAAPWLNSPGLITPLIDTRLRAVVRRDRLNLTFTWDSTLTIAPAHP